MKTSNSAPVFAYVIDDLGFISHADLYYEGELPKDFVLDTAVSGLIKPKWNGSEWVEGATQEEIDELTKPQPAPPSDSDRIQALEEALLNMMMEGMM